jgi:DNA-directed RNA polymerase
MFAKEILDKLENLDVEMIGNKNISTVLDLDEKQEEYIKKLEKLHKKQPTKLRMKKRLINELEDDIEDLEEDVKNGNVILKKNKYYKKIKKRVFVEESLISLIDDKIDRSFVKSAVMTDSYGASTKSKGNKLKEKMEKLNIIEDENILFKFSQYLAKKIDAIIDKEIKSSEKYKKWISSIAKEILKTENQIEWKTPLGFIVSQNEYKTKKQILSTNLGKITIHIYTDEIDKKKNKTAIAPNFIHSLDATHLFKTINSLKKKGLKDFITIHDSFATHANDVMTLSKTLREEFVDLYSKNVLEDFIDNVNNIYNLNLEKKIPYINKDTFTLKEILNSIYLFS